MDSWHKKVWETLAQLTISVTPYQKGGYILVEPCSLPTVVDLQMELIAHAKDVCLSRKNSINAMAC